VRYCRDILFQLGRPRAVLAATLWLAAIDCSQGSTQQHSDAAPVTVPPRTMARQDAANPAWGGSDDNPPPLAVAYPVVEQGSSWVQGVPEVGAVQMLEVDWTPPHVPSGPFLVRVGIPGANIDTTVGNSKFPIRAGAKQVLMVPLNIPGDSSRPIPLDGPIPFQVTIDPTGASGIAGLPYVIDGAYTPVPPAAVIEAYQSQSRVAGIGVQASITAGMGATCTLFMGNPIDTNHQTVQSILSNSWSVYRGQTQIAQGSFSMTTTGLRPPFYAQSMSQWLPGATAMQAQVRVQLMLSRVRVNRDILDQITWDELATGVAGEPDLSLYLGADAVNDPSDPSIAAFVSQVLGADWKRTMLPYTAARKLFVAVSNAITYQGGTAAKPTPSTAVAALAAGWGDCGDYGMLLTTVLRAIGIPARIEYGQWPTGGGTHVITQFWMPGAAWIPADATSSSTLFPKSGYPYFFGNVPALDVWVGFGFGNDYQGDGLKLSWVEGPGFANVTNVNVTSWNVTQTNDPGT
jgi:transglutaminase-like putative cysteine protease